MPLNSFKAALGAGIILSTLAACQKRPDLVNTNSDMASSSLATASQPAFNETEFHTLSDKVKVLDQDNDTRKLLEEIDRTAYLKPAD